MHIGFERHALHDGFSSRIAALERANYRALECAAIVFASTHTRDFEDFIQTTRVEWLVIQERYGHHRFCAPAGGHRGSDSGVMHHDPCLRKQRGVVDEAPDEHVRRAIAISHIVDEFAQIQALQPELPAGRDCFGEPERCIPAVNMRAE
jgi:hypothetical protein